MEKLKEILNNIKCKDGLSFVDLLEMVNEKNYKILEKKIIYLIEDNQKKFDEAILIIFNDKSIVKLDNKIKLKLISNFLINLAFGVVNG